MIYALYMGLKKQKKKKTKKKKQKKKIKYVLPLTGRIKSVSSVCGRSKWPIYEFIYSQ